MRVLLPFCAALCVFALPLEGKTGFGAGGQEYGYVDVREGAHMFYWLYYVEGGDEPASKPLVIWLQGGPGSSSTGYGNFMEMGPQYLNLTERPTSWANHVNLLFIDSPVGSGFSYVDSYSKLLTNNQEIVADLMVCIETFLETYPSFQTLPVYIFTESYGGKVTAELALNLYEAMTAGSITIDFKGVALGDSWISPIDSMLTWAPYLLETGVLDTAGYKAVEALTQRLHRELDAGRYFQATRLWARSEAAIMDLAKNISFYNILYKLSAPQAQSVRRSLQAGVVKDTLFQSSDEDATDRELDTLMNGDVRAALNVSEDVTYQTSSDLVFNALYGDIMKPVTDIVDKLLQNTSLTVTLYSGQLDLVVDTPGTIAWVRRLQWDGISSWETASRTPFVVDNIVEGFVKTYDKFSFYWISRSGHMVPTDNPTAALKMMRRVTGCDSSE